MRLIGHPLVFGLICFGLLIAVTLLLVTIGEGGGLHELLSRLDPDLRDLRCLSQLGITS